MAETTFVYGVWLRAIDGERQAVASLPQEEFAELLKKAMKHSGHDVDLALEMVRKELESQLRRL